MLRVSSFVVPFCTGTGDVGALKLAKKLPNDSYQIIGLKSIMICWEVWTISFDKRGPPNLQFRIVSQTCCMFLMFLAVGRCSVFCLLPKTYWKTWFHWFKHFRLWVCQDISEKAFCKSGHPIWIPLIFFPYTSYAHVIMLCKLWQINRHITKIMRNTIMLFRVQKSSFVDPKNTKTSSDPWFAAISSPYR